MECTIEQLIDRTENLPTIPEAALAAMREAESSTGSASSVAAHIKRDQSLAARVLRLSNSAYYGLEGQITDIQDSVIVLGMRCVRNLAMVAATYPWLSTSLDGYGAKPNQMWEHAVAVAIGAQILAQNSEKCDPDAAFTAGLMHDLGKIVLSVHLGRRIEPMIKMAAKTNHPFHELERQVLGYDHQEVGAALAGRWNLPQQFIAAIRFHHEPDNTSEFQAVVDCVHIGAHLAMSMGLGVAADGLCYPWNPASLDRLGVAHDELESLIPEFLERYAAFQEGVAQMAA